MKKTLRIVGIILVIVLVATAGILSYVKFALPNVGDAPEVTIKASAAQIERGRYLAHHVNVCIDCHSTRDWSRFSAPPLEGTLGKGGDRFGPEMGFPGTFYSRNITPAGLKDWSDGEIVRAITAGVSRDGRALFPVMPHPNYGRMDLDDVTAIVAYLRTLTPVPSEIPASEADFPMNFIVNTIPQKPNFSKRPDTTDVLAYGAYLVNAASCSECHTKREQGAPVEGMDFAGGAEFVMPGAMMRSANITPDKETGIGTWTREAFITRFKAYDPAHGYQAPAVAAGEKQSIMPWVMYAGMTERDLGAIYTYLRTLKPIENRVVTFETVSDKAPLATR